MAFDPISTFQAQIKGAKKPEFCFFSYIDTISKVHTPAELEDFEKMAKVMYQQYQKENLK